MAPLILVLFALQAPCAIIDMINAMPDNSWLLLPDSGPKPRVVSSSPVMHYDGDSLAYLWGTWHTGTTNGVWSYNLSANRWTRHIPDDPDAASNPASIIVHDSVLMTATGHPLSFHQWSGMDWDPVGKRLWWTTIGSWQGLYNTAYDSVLKYHPDSNNALTANKVMWEYNPAANLWTPHRMPNPYPIVYYGNSTYTFRYVPYLKKFIGLHSTAYGDGYFTFFDPDSMTLKKKPVAFDTLPGDYRADYDFSFGHIGAVYDTRHEVLLTQSASGTWEYNPKTNRFSELVLASASPPVSTDCPVSHMVWDPGNEIALVFVTAGGMPCYNADSQYAARGWPSSGTRVFAFDYENRRWDMLPDPVAGDDADSIPGVCGHSYFDSRLGVVFHFGGGYAAMNGQRWVYKYKTPAGSKREMLPRTLVDEWVRVSPNPAADQARIQFVPSGSAFEQVSVYDLHGRLVSGLSGAVLDTRGLANGLYLIRAETQGKRLSKKFLVQH